jgi:hypothetical protein
VTRTQPRTSKIDIITRGICASCFVFLATAAGAGISYLISVAGGL